MAVYAAGYFIGEVYLSFLSASYQTAISATQSSLASLRKDSKITHPEEASI